jgi:hypothetical protein
MDSTEIAMTLLIGILLVSVLYLDTLPSAIQQITQITKAPATQTSAPILKSGVHTAAIILANKVTAIASVR